MKSNFFTLMKVDLRETLDFRKFKNDKVKATSFVTLLVFFGLLFFAISCLYNLMIVASLKETGKYEVGIVLVGALASVVCLSTSIFRVKSIFTGKDYEMLKTMPIKKRDIIAAKLVNLYLIETLYASIFILPCCIITAVFSKNYLYIPFGIIYNLLIVGFPIILSAIFSALISIVFDRFKLKNVLSIIFYLVFFVGIFMLSFMMQTGNNGELLAMFERMGTILSYINPTIFLFKLAFTSNYIFILLYICASLLSLILGILFIALLFDKVYEAINSIRSNVKYVRRAVATRGQFKSLFILEAKRLFSSKMYFVNCLSSVIMSIALSIMLCFGTFNNLVSIIDVKRYAYAFSLLPIFCLGVCTASSASISIEGRNLWLVKTLPINYHKWLNAKMLLSLIISMVGALTSSIIMIIIFKPSIISIISLIIIPLLFTLMATAFGLYANLHYNKFNWNNEREVVKNSASVSIALFVDWGFTILFAGLLIGLSFVNEYLAILSTIFTILLLSFVFYRLSHNNIEKRVIAFGEE